MCCCMYACVFVVIFGGCFFTSNTILGQKSKKSFQKNCCPLRSNLLVVKWVKKDYIEITIYAVPSKSSACMFPLCSSRICLPLGWWWTGVAWAISHFCIWYFCSLFLLRTHDISVDTKKTWYPQEQVYWAEFCLVFLLRADADFPFAIVLLIVWCLERCFFTSNTILGQMSKKSSKKIFIKKHYYTYSMKKSIVGVWSCRVSYPPPLS